jgi:hypothetical protein
VPLRLPFTGATLYSCAVSVDATHAQNLSGQLGVIDPSSIVEDNGTYYLFYTVTRVRSKTSTDPLH